MPREAPHELDARRVVGPAAQERDLGVEGRGAERAEVRSNLCMQVKLANVIDKPGHNCTKRLNT